MTGYGLISAMGRKYMHGVGADIHSSDAKCPFYQAAEPFVVLFDRAREGSESRLDTSLPSTDLIGTSAWVVSFDPAGECSYSLIAMPDTKLALKVMRLREIAG